MPYIEVKKQKGSNYWFSSSDGHPVNEFNRLLSEKNIYQLEKEGGLCIMYTHFASGFYNESTSELNPEFIKCMRHISSRQGWFVPVGEILDFLQNQKGRGGKLSILKAIRMDIIWIIDRLIKRFSSGF